MLNGKTSIRHLPPLARVKQLASTPFPGAGWVTWLEQHTATLADQIDEAWRLVYLRPAPTFGAIRHLALPTSEMEELRAALAVLHSPTEMLIWVNRARIQSDTLAGVLSRADQCVEELRYALPETPAWKKALTLARELLERAAQHSRELRDHVQLLIDASDDQDLEQPHQAKIIPFPAVGVYEHPQ